MSYCRAHVVHLHIHIVPLSTDNNIPISKQTLGGEVNLRPVNVNILTHFLIISPWSPVRLADSFTKISCS